MPAFSSVCFSLSSIVSAKTRSTPAEITLCASVAETFGSTCKSGCVQSSLASDKLVSYPIASTTSAKLPESTATFWGFAFNVTSFTVTGYSCETAPDSIFAGCEHAVALNATKTLKTIAAAQRIHFFISISIRRKSGILTFRVISAQL